MSQDQRRSPVSATRFADEMVAMLESFAQACTLPEVVALHLPPAPTAGEERGEFCALELADGSLGVSYVLLDDTLQALRTAGGHGELRGADPLALARRYAQADPTGRTLGFAAVNALTRCLFDRAGFAPPAATDSIGALDPHPGDRVGMIGLFMPLLPRIVARGARITVIELREELAGPLEGFEGCEVTLDDRALEGCRQVLSTGTLLLNDTLDRMLARCAGAERFAMVGPSVGCLPDGLFARGVTSIGGSWIVDGTGFVEALRAGERRGDSARKFTLTPAGYPGFDTLVARL